MIFSKDSFTEHYLKTLYYYTMKFRSSEKAEEFVTKTLDYYTTKYINSEKAEEFITKLYLRLIE